MLDPLTVTTTIVTLATFIKDLIELGEGIRSSIEKVGENRRQIRELAQDIVRTLYDLASLTRGKEGAFRGPELLTALESLKTEMLYVHSRCLRISPIQLPGLWGIPSHLKTWRKRDDLEKKIARLRERANKCLLEFTAFSAARIERAATEIAHTTLRIEQRLIVDNVENQVKARRLEGLVARFMLESEFGQHKLRETVETISADSSFQSLEYQYMSAQLNSLINSVKPLLACEDLSLPTLFIGWSPNEIAPSEPSLHTPSHALFHILGIIVALHSQDHGPLLDLLMAAMDDLPACFILAGMHSEAIVWDHFGIDLLRYLMKKGYDIDTGTLPRLAVALSHISVAFYSQFKLDAAIEFSRQSLALWVEVSRLLSEVDCRIGHLVSMVIHAENFLAKDDKTAMSLACPMAQALAESIASSGRSLTASEQCNVHTFCDAFFVLAEVLSSLDCPLDSYKAFLDAFRTACSLPICGYNPNRWARYIDSFLDDVCKVAEDGCLSLSMLPGYVDLFRNLARIYPKQFSSAFLRILHAFAYYSQQPHSYHSMEQIRLFLEPTYDATPPAIDIATSILIDSSILTDAIRLFFAEALEVSTIPLIQNIFVAHFPQAIEALRVVVQNPVFDSYTLAWVLLITCQALPHLSPAEYLALLQVLVEAFKCKSSHGVLETLSLEEWEMDFASYFYRVCRHAARLGVVDEGISFCQELAVHVEAQSNAHLRAVVFLRELLELCALLLCDAARFPDAADLVKEKGSRFPQSGDLGPGSGDLTLWVIKAHILQRVGRHKEALQLVRMGVADGIRKFWLAGRSFDIQLYFLFSQLAWAWKQAGEPLKALENAEKAVAACYDVDTEDTEEETMLCAQIHSLTTHSNCLAAVGRPAEGLASAQKAASIYTEYSDSESMWKNFIFTIRRQELGGNTFFALSLRLLAVDHNEEALSNGRRATGLYRELAALAPRHLPTLARSLQHLASILWLLGHQNEAIAASEEAVDTLRKVVEPETYFLPLLADALDELAGYLTKRGDNSGAATATAEAVAARVGFASLPPGPEWLFERLEAEDGEDADWWEWEPEKYHGALEDPASIRVEADERGTDGSEVESDAGYEDALEIITLVDDEAQTVIADTPESQCRSAFASSRDDTDKTSINELDVRNGGRMGAVIARESAEGSGNNAFLSKQVEISLRLSMRSTPMDVLWWILLLLPAILFAVMYARLVQSL
ncbi:Tetratricopeptide repeat family [Favolaschia claudopus]|uniref:Tetratricopeptide repeat family n=1 Tax=Favolaschia claudopus TaxID=2862362 RepID=A0AAW0AB24_9AGAR